MTRDEFEKQVRERAPPELPPDAVVSAIRHHTRIGELSTREHVRQCIQLAGSLAEDPRYAVRQELLEGGPTAALNQQEVLEGIDGSVRQIRERVFGSPEPPFTPEQYPEAVAWLEAEDERTFRRLTPDESARIAEIREEVHTLMEERWRLERHHWKVETRWPMVRYLRPRDGTSPTLQVRGNSLLYPLVDGAAKVAEATGISDTVVVAYILAGIPPVVPRVNIWENTRGITLPDGRYARRETITITLNDFFISESEIRWILQQVRKQRGETVENAALRSILRRMGGVPEHARRTFWEEVLEEWVDAGLAADGKDPAGALSRRFRRLPETEKRSLWRQYERRKGAEQEPGEHSSVRQRAL